MISTLAARKVTTNGSSANQTRRTSLPAIQTKSPSNFLSPRISYLEEISEFDGIEPPFLSPSSMSSSSSSTCATPTPTETTGMQPTSRPHSARLYRRNKRTSHLRKRYFDYWQEEDSAKEKQASEGLSMEESGDKTASSIKSYDKKWRCNADELRKTNSMFADDNENNNITKELKFNKGSSNHPINNSEELRRKIQNQQKIRFLRHFLLDSTGRVSNNGLKNVSNVLFKPKQTELGSNKSRRNTCPEIWLNYDECDERKNKPALKCIIKLFGSLDVGKKSLFKLLEKTVDVHNEDADEDITSIASDDSQRINKSINFLLNNTEINMEIQLEGSTNQKNIQGSERVVFVVVYSITDRESFSKASKILDTLQKRQNVSVKRQLILLGNKVDLQRKRCVKIVEGKTLAKIYQCHFMEVSATLCVNKDELWHEILRHLQKASKNCPEIASDLANRNKITKILNRTRRFAKSCEDWLTSKIISTSDSRLS